MGIVCVCVCFGVKDVKIEGVEFKTKETGSEDIS